MTDPQNNPPGFAPAGSSQPPPGQNPANDAQQNRDIAALGYVWILSLVVYFAKRDSPFVRFHARQGIVLFILSVIVWMIPFIGQLLELVILALVVLGFLAAAQGQQKDLPVIGPIARRDMAGVRKSWREMIDALARGWQQMRAKRASPGPVTSSEPRAPSNPKDSSFSQVPPPPHP